MTLKLPYLLVEQFDQKKLMIIQFVKMLEWLQNVVKLKHHQNAFDMNHKKSGLLLGRAASAEVKRCLDRYVETEVFGGVPDAKKPKKTNRRYYPLHKDL